MTWLSRLLPQSPSQHPANHNHRTRQAQRRRRMATLETLEGRTLLSNVTVSFAGRRPHDPGGRSQRLLQYHGTVRSRRGQSDGHFDVASDHDQQDQRTIREPPSGHVDHCQSPGHHQLRLRLPARSGQDHTDDRQERYHPDTRPTGANLTFTANKVDNNGALRSGYMCRHDAVLTANVDNSSFGTVAINQAGGSKAVVELGNDNIPGPACRVMRGMATTTPSPWITATCSGTTELHAGRWRAHRPQLASALPIPSTSPTPAPGTWTIEQSSMARTIPSK